MTHKLRACFLRYELDLVFFASGKRHAASEFSEGGGFPGLEKSLFWPEEFLKRGFDALHPIKSMIARILRVLTRWVRGGFLTNLLTSFSVIPGLILDLTKKSSLFRTNKCQRVWATVQIDCYDLPAFGQLAVGDFSWVRLGCGDPGAVFTAPVLKTTKMPGI
jgi:hypothetical protein